MEHCCWKRCDKSTSRKPQRPTVAIEVELLTDVKDAHQCKAGVKETYRIRDE